MNILFPLFWRFIVALSATPIAKKIAVKVGAVDIPRMKEGFTRSRLQGWADLPLYQVSCINTF
jgi:hypothetical protein